MNNKKENPNKKVNELLKKSKIDINDFHNAETLTDSYIVFAKDIDKKKINLGFPKLDEFIRGLRVQELLTVISKTGIGKSALALNFLLNFVKKTNELTVLFSLEMSTVGIGERVFQIELDKFCYDIERGFKNKDKAFIESCRKLQYSSLSNFIVVTNRIEIDELPNYIKAIELIKGKKVRLIAVDYIGLMDNRLFQKDEYLRTTENMKKLYKYAKILDTAIINLSQTSRADVKGNTNGLSLYSGKSSGEIEHSSDFVLTMEKIEKPNQDEALRDKSIQDYNKKCNEKFDLLKLVVWKNRRGKGEVAIVYITFNRKNLRIKEYDSNQFKISNNSEFMAGETRF